MRFSTTLIAAVGGATLSAATATLPFELVAYLAGNSDFQNAPVNSNGDTLTVGLPTTHSLAGPAADYYKYTNTTVMALDIDGEYEGWVYMATGGAPRNEVLYSEYSTSYSTVSSWSTGFAPSLGLSSFAISNDNVFSFTGGATYACTLKADGPYYIFFGSPLVSTVACDVVTLFVEYLPAGTIGAYEY